MPTREIVYRDDQYNVTIYVKSATVLDGIQHSVYTLEAQDYFFSWQHKNEGASVLERNYMYIMCVLTYPAVRAATDKITNHREEGKTYKQLRVPTSVDAFLKLPDTLVRLWSEAAFEVNPHWMIDLDQATGDDASGEAQEPSGESE